MFIPAQVSRLAAAGWPIVALEFTAETVALTWSSRATSLSSSALVGVEYLRLVYMSNPKCSLGRRRANCPASRRQSTSKVGPHSLVASETALTFANPLSWVAVLGPARRWATLGRVRPKFRNQLHYPVPFLDCPPSSTKISVATARVQRSLDVGFRLDRIESGALLG